MNVQDIKEIRANLGISQEALARMIGVSTATINRWETGAFKPSLMAIEKINKLKGKLTK